jgi:predicted lactoylglutathione lyase
MKMSYCVLGTNNMGASIKFYDSLFEQSDINQVFADQRMTFWQGSGFTFALAKPFNGEPSNNGNGTMIGFSAGSIEAVKRIHNRAIELGGSCEGEPNHRGPKLSAYVRDLDKNKLYFFE